jgi:lipoic acid synthetase
MLMGDVCTRTCGFCAVAQGAPGKLDPEEPARVAKAAAELGLSHAVVTSVNRDDLADGGAAHFAATIRAIRDAVPGCTVEVLIPDFRGDEAALETVLEAEPEVLNHNTETVPRLYRRVRPQARYAQSLELLARADAWRCQSQSRDSGLGTRDSRRHSLPGLPAMKTKSGLIVGLGETRDEVLETLSDLRAARCDIVTIGQYLQPHERRLPIEKYYTPEEFEEFRREGEAMGFARVESGPLVRSSYHAKRAIQ